MSRILIILLIAAVPAFGQTVRYRVTMPEPRSHLFHVEMSIDDPGVNVMELALPAWNALYQVRDFSQYLQRFEANASWKRVDKQTWRFDASGKKEIRVNYTVYANESSPFSSQLDETHGFFNGANLLLLWKGKQSLPAELEVVPPSGWTVATSLPATGRANVFRAENYDHLVDCPVDAGNLDRHSFTVQDVPIYVIVDGPHRRYNSNELVAMLEKIVRAQAQLMGEIPFKHYYFLYHFTSERSGGGMEHRDSTAIHRTFQPGESSVGGLAGVSSHEFFHLWNVKRIRPLGLEPIDYFSEDYTTALWFSEGFTSYYGDLMLRRAGIMSKEQFYDLLASEIYTLQSRPGRQLLSAADASLLTWYDKYPFYRRAENSISYYNKGLLIGLLLDLKIRDATDNRFSMDHVMLHLNENYAKKGKYFEDDFGIAKAITEATGLNLDKEYAAYVHGRDDLPYKDVLELVGLSLIERTTSTPSFGMTMTRNFDGPLFIESIEPGGPAGRAGLRVGEQITRVNDRVVDRDLRDLLARALPGERILVGFQRDGSEQTTELFVGSNETVRYEIRESSNLSAKQRRILESWLAGR